MSGYPEYSGDDALVPVTGRPRTPQLADEYGHQTFYGTTDNAISTPPVDPRTLDLFHYGVLNGGFGRGPADIDSPIEDINPLPDWTVVENTGDFVFTWLGDGTSPSGHVLKVEIVPGGALGTATLVQFLPFGSSGVEWASAAIRATVTRHSATNDGFLFTLSASYATSNDDSTLVGSVSSNDLTWTGNTTKAAVVQPNIGHAADANARFIWVELRISRDSAGTGDTAIFHITDVRADQGVVQLTLGDASGGISGDTAQIIYNGSDIIADNTYTLTTTRVGSGSPEGSVSAAVGTLWIDTTNGEIYIKHTGSGNTGWKLITHA